MTTYLHNFPKVDGKREGQDPRTKAYLKSAVEEVEEIDWTEAGDFCIALAALQVVREAEQILYDLDPNELAYAYESRMARDINNGMYQDIKLEDFLNERGIEFIVKKCHDERPGCLGIHMPEDDPVEHPAHYEGPVEAIEVIETITEGLPSTSAYLLGNVLKYALRAGRKGEAAIDLSKANNYAHRLVYGQWRHERSNHDNQQTAA